MLTLTLTALLLSPLATLYAAAVSIVADPTKQNDAGLSAALRELSAAAFLVFPSEC